MIAAAWITVALLLCAVAALGVKVILLRRGARELREGLRERLTEETNTLLTISTRDGELRRLADALNSELRKLRSERLRYQRGDRELREAVAGISHDLRTPLTAMIGYLELLQALPLSSDARRYTIHLEERTRAMKRLTQELLAYSAAASVPALRLQSVDLRRALEETLLAFYGAASLDGAAGRETTGPGRAEPCAGKYPDKRAAARGGGSFCLTRRERHNDLLKYGFRAGFCVCGEAFRSVLYRGIGKRLKRPRFVHSEAADGADGWKNPCFFSEGRLTVTLLFGEKIAPSETRPKQMK